MKIEESALHSECIENAFKISFASPDFEKSLVYNGKNPAVEEVWLEKPAFTTSSTFKSAFVSSGSIKTVSPF